MANSLPADDGALVAAQDDYLVSDDPIRGIAMDLMLGVQLSVLAARDGKYNEPATDHFASVIRALISRLPTAEDGEPKPCNDRRYLDDGEHRCRMQRGHGGDHADHWKTWSGNDQREVYRPAQGPLCECGHQLVREGRAYECDCACRREAGAGEELSASGSTIGEAASPNTRVTVRPLREDPK